MTRRATAGVDRELVREDEHRRLGHGSWSGSAVESGREPGPLVDEAAPLAGDEVGPLVAQQRQGDPLAPDVAEVHVREEQALVEQGRGEHGRPARADDLRAAPERDRLVDADPVAEDDERRRQLGVGPHQRPPRVRRPEADLGGAGEVATRRRRHVDQHLRAVEGEHLRRREVPEVLADREAHADAQARRRRAQLVARREEPPLVEQPVGRQEHLAVDVADLPVLEQRGRDEQPMVAGLLHERHHGRQPVGLGGQRRQPRVVEPHRDVGREVLQLVSGQPELREHHESRATGSRLRQQVGMAREVGLEVAEAWRELGEGDPQGLHGPSLGPRRGRRRDRRGGRRHGTRRTVRDDGGWSRGVSGARGIRRRAHRRIQQLPGRVAPGRLPLLLRALDLLGEVARHLVARSTSRAGPGPRSRSARGCRAARAASTGCGSGSPTAG